ncbi:Hypothetical protein I595_119 [Croceitalea dokdonensis DOKDO 023]|uniref:Uncharacterized protein n=1 Tax=Croceitalea dokdonensis DOKDO 023 TaxID=1300341 RepID=A0A0P7A8M0_9FLAO|nr:Hypothetical protein I595_119 [Croceitalea dokdonensis DOKDO 023]
MIYHTNLSNTKVKVLRLEKNLKTVFIVQRSVSQENEI